MGGFSPLVFFAEVAFFPIVWPISLILDKALGHDDQVGIDKAQMKGLVRALRKNDGNTINIDEETILHGVLEMHHKTAKDAAHSLESALGIGHSDVLNSSMFKQLDLWGKSRVFVYKDGCPHKVLFVKKLINHSSLWTSETIEQLPHLKSPLVMRPDENLLEVLNRFQKGTNHLAIISENPEAVIDAWQKDKPIPKEALPTHYLTLEDVIEEMIKEEIEDEDDVDVEKAKGKKSPSVVGQQYALKR